MTEDPQALGQNYPCGECGAQTQYDAASQGLKCPYCGHQQAIPAQGGAMAPREIPIAEGMRMAARGLGTPVKEIGCDECGANVAVEPQAQTVSCPFCRSERVLPREAAGNQIRPESVVPFRVDKAAANNAFGEWIGGLWFRPNDLKKMAKVQELGGVYIPFWTFDAQVHSRWSAEAGYYYKELEVDSEGNEREVTRTRMVLTQHRARMKNRLLATLAKYGLAIEDCSDNFGVQARAQWEELTPKLPEQTQWCTQLLWEQLELVDRQIQQQEKRLEQLVEITPAIKLLQTLPGVGLILASVIAMEIGQVSRFASAGRLASYAGTTPRVHSSGGKTRYGKLRPDVNRYLKWAVIEAGNCVAIHASRKPERHVSQLYQRLRQRRNHAKAVGAVARHLAEAAYWILAKEQAYRDPSLVEQRKA